MLRKTNFIAHFTDFFMYLAIINLLYQKRHIWITLFLLLIKPKVIIFSVVGVEFNRIKILVSLQQRWFRKTCKTHITEVSGAPHNFRIQSQKYFFSNYLFIQIFPQKWTYLKHHMKITTATRLVHKRKKQKKISALTKQCGEIK